MSNPKPLDDLRALIAQFTSDNISIQVSDFKELNKFSELGKWLTHYQGGKSPKLSEVHICILASTYDTIDGVESVTQFITSAGKGRETVNLLCKERGIGLRVLEMAPSIPHKMNGLWREEECMAATAFGMEATAAGGDLLGISSFAPGDKAATLSLIKRIKNNKNQYFERSLESNTLRLDALDLMREYAGREVAGIVGSLIAARSRGLPVLVEGWAALGAMCVLASLDTHSIDHIQVASVSCKKQRGIAKSLGKCPIIGPKVSIGPGCGIALAVSAISPLLYLER